MSVGTATAILRLSWISGLVEDVLLGAVAEGDFWSHAAIVAELLA